MLRRSVPDLSMFCKMLLLGFSLSVIAVVYNGISVSIAVFANVAGIK